MTRDLFDHAVEERIAREMPLAARMRPRELDEFVGQEHLVGPGAPLRTALEEDHVWSVILWGPPGSGKTTLARIAAATTGRHFIGLSAVTAGVREARAAIEEAREQRRLHERRTLVFLDEIHRFNKAQQDALLPHVEDGTIALWGATTENPSFTVIAPLLSRMQVLRLRPLEPEQVRTIVERAIADAEHGPERSDFDGGAIDSIVNGAGGDARVALNWAESAAVYATHVSAAAITAEIVERAMLERRVQYDRAGESHYDTISAFIKSVRGSDPDAALFWLAKMLQGGEAPEFITRRLIILASEDIGNADPQGLGLVIAAAQAVERLGLPEARFALAQATIYLAAAPKSNAAGRALDAAERAIADGADLTVPLHLRNEAFRGAEAEGYGEGYTYPHDHPGNYVKQRYLPDDVNSSRFYDGQGSGYEREMWDELQRRRSKGASSETDSP